ncbi:sirohydrochlorin cobaltochelatase [Haloimpatiens sp. FM7330]|uniref:sirohydrochlorin cobaltochelatase n=1 Tax=Haloimpatiens sp. FM7330 TaxID=3298610 RepID=UPI00363401A9
MKKVLISIVSMTLALSMLAGCGTAGSKKNDNKDETKTTATNTKKSDKKGILVISFGTSYADTRKVTIEAVEEKVKNTFKDYEVKRAFTSKIIRKKLKERDNIIVDSPEEALSKMQKEGFSEIYVQPLHIMPGIEYDEVKEVVDKFNDKKAFDKLVLGRPLLYRAEDYKIAADAFKKQLPKLNKDQAVAIMGHGTEHPSNSSYALFQYALEEKGMGNILVGTVEGYPTVDNVVRRLKEKGIKEVTLMPFMLVAGDHANNDMAGDEKDSWKNVLKSNGFKVNTYIHGLGENEDIREIYIQHIKDSIDGNPLKEEK